MFTLQMFVHQKFHVNVLFPNCKKLYIIFFSWQSWQVYDYGITACFSFTYSVLRKDNTQHNYDTALQNENYIFNNRKGKCFTEHRTM